MSYARNDNTLLHKQEQGWIDIFMYDLNVLLERRFGICGSVKIWLDRRKIDGSQDFDQSITDGLNNSAVLLCFHSTSYRRSEYCNKELSAFYQKSKSEPTGIKIGDRYRIINILLNNIPHQEWPEELSGASGFQFHDGKEPGDLGDPIKTDSEKFQEGLKDIRDSIEYTLRELEAFVKKQNTLQEDKVPEVKAETETFTIYLGEVSDTLRTSRKRAVAELEKKGYKILAGIPPPFEALAHERATLEALERADLSIHLLDEFPGRDIENLEDISYPQAQTMLAGNSPKSQMIWVPADLKLDQIEVESYRSFLMGIEKGQNDMLAVDFIRGAKSTIVQEIIEMSEQVRIRQLNERAAASGLSVLLDTHATDDIYARQLSNTLLEHNIQTFINPQEDDPKINSGFLNERIGQVKKLIFLYGAVPREWIFERVRAAVQLIITNEYSIEDFYVFLAPPHKNASEISFPQKFLKINIVDYSQGAKIEPASLDEFLNQLKMSTT
ncbi:MAG: toll/interleukin-1 receptor domain-containing protein [Flavobacteriales bacterium]